MVCFVRMKRADLPLERDEGEYAYAGQLILEGIPPYKLAYNMKLPGTYVCYAVSMAIFGHTVTGIRMGLMAVNCGAIVLMFLLAQRFFRPAIAVLGAATFAVISLSPAVLGFAAHATQYVVLFGLAGLLLLLKAIDTRRLLLLFSSGVLLGLAFVMKQPGIVFTWFALFWIGWINCRMRPINWKTLGIQAGVFLVGAALPLIGTCLILLNAGVFSKFWFWTISYARAYGTIVPFGLGMSWLANYFRGEIGFTWIFWIIAAVGLFCTLVQKRMHSNAVLFSALLLFSLLGVAAGLYFRPHYFMLVLPALTLLVCAAIDTAQQLFKRPFVRALPVIAFVAIWSWVLWQNRLYFFVVKNDIIPYYLYHGNPFKEAIEIGNYVREHSNPTDTVAIFGSEPEIYFYSQRHSATGYIYTYPLTEPHAYATVMQKELIQEIEAAKPKFIVAAKVHFSWGNVPRAGEPMTQWMDDYLRNNYQQVLLVPVEEADTTAKMNAATEGSFMYVFERKNG